MRIDLTHVAYDARHACFRADAILHHGSHHRAITCAWHGPRLGELYFLARLASLLRPTLISGKEASRGPCQAQVMARWCEP